MKTFICDNCGDKYEQALDEEKLIDEHKIVHVLDLCVSCRKKLEEDKKKAAKEFLINLTKRNK